MASSRPLPVVGMSVRVMHLGSSESGVIAEVHEHGRTLVVEGRRFTLRALNGRYVEEGRPYYGTWLSLRG